MRFRLFCGHALVETPFSLQSGFDRIISDPGEDLIQIHCQLAKLISTLIEIRGKYRRGQLVG